MGDHSPDGGSRPPRSYLKLRGLHRAMLAKGLTRVIFTGSNHGSTVETLFCADDDPMVLCVAVTHPAGTPTCAFEWEVQMPDYRVNTHLGDKYGTLLDALGLTKGQRGREPFKPSEFFVQRARPGTAGADRRQPAEPIPDPPSASRFHRGGGRQDLLRRMA